MYLACYPFNAREITAAAKAVAMQAEFRHR
jgi:hypothetical protein